MPENNTSATFIPLLSACDWNEEWKQLQKARRAIDNAAYWDERAKTFSTKDSPRSYTQQFLELANIHEDETVFDMGCGTGALCIPLGAAGHKVIAADFSQGMLNRLDEEVSRQGITTVVPKQMSWSDNWAEHGISSSMVDVCIASRSIATADLKDSLMRLTDVARRRVCITLATGSSPRTDERILRAIGLESVFGRDYWYAFNILVSAGIMPEIHYIQSTRSDTYDSHEDAFDALASMASDATATLVSEATLKSALVRLRDWVGSNVVANESAGQLSEKGFPEKRLRLREPRIVTWAFISWNK